MTEKIIVKSTQELQEYKLKINDNIQRTVLELRLLLEENPFEVFSKMKFEKIAIEPLTGNPENLIEVINQLQTYLVSIKAVEYLLNKHIGKAFTINWGNIPGYDIESLDGDIIAECFAATSYRSNGKLTSDLKRLSLNTTAKIKYEFFYDKEFNDNNKDFYQEKYPDISIVKFTSTDI